MDTILETGAAVDAIRQGAEAPRKKRRSPLNMKVQAVEISEKVREQHATITLTGLGYVVKHLGKPVPVVCRNPQCRAHQFAGTTGNSPGVADLIVSHPTHWPSGTWKMLETKKSGRAPRRPEQVRLAEMGLSTFYVTEEQAVRAVIDAERRMGLAPNPRALDWLRVNVKGALDSGTAALLADDLPNAAWRP